MINSFVINPDVFNEENVKKFDESLMHLKSNVENYSKLIIDKD